MNRKRHASDALSNPCIYHVIYYSSAAESEVWFGGTNDVERKFQQDMQAYKRYKDGKGKWKEWFRWLKHGDATIDIFETYKDLDADKDKALKELQDMRDHCVSIFTPLDVDDTPSDTVLEMETKHALDAMRPQSQPNFIWKRGPCPWPGCNYVIKSHPERHGRVHTKETPFHCRECQYKCKEKGKLDKHVSAVHRDERKHACSDCERKFARIGDLTKHIKTVHRGEREFECLECKRKFTRKSGLEQHTSAVHQRQKRFSCLECDRKYTQKAGLDQHVSVVHRGERRFACEICEHKATTKQNLEHHVSSVHRGERNYICGECEEKFTRKSHLDKHVSAVHRMERRFECSECDAKFAEKGNLNKHISSWHTAEGQRRHKRSEERFFRELKLRDVVVDEREQRLSFGCFDAIGKFARIDGVLQKPKHKFMLENDEFGHRGNPVKCEVERMVNVHTTQQLTDPERSTVFVRFNPDACRIGGKKLNIRHKDRMDKLVAWLNTYTPKLPFEIHTWWYDEDEDGQLELTKDADFPAELVACVCAHK